MGTNKQEVGIDMFSWQDQSESQMHQDQVDHFDKVCASLGGKEWTFLSWDSLKRGSIQIISNLQKDGCSIEFLQAILIHMWRGLEEFKSVAQCYQGVPPERMDA